MRSEPLSLLRTRSSLASFGGSVWPRWSSGTRLRWVERLTTAGETRPRSRAGQAARPPNKRMQLTKLRAAPVLQAEVPPCAPAGGTDGGTASQLICSVRQTTGLRWKATGTMIPR